MEQILTLLGQYAFPIVACVAMGWYVVHKDREHHDEVESLWRAHHDEVSSLRQAVENNTIAMTKLLERD